MKIELSYLKLTNFKKVRSQTITFGHITNIHGDNATGKTTLFDAFLWLLFGKDSTDRKDFEIKTLDENNQHYHRLDHEVEGCFVIDGQKVVLRRLLREKWTKKRGGIEQEFTGHETTYFWNDVPMLQKEYEQKIASIIQESIFKLIANTNYFNSLKWQDRRAVLTAIAGEINDQELAAGNPDFERLMREITGKKSLEGYRREIVANKNKLKQELDNLPVRISEAKNALPEEKDYAAIEEQIAEANKQIELLDGMLQSKSQAAKQWEEGKVSLINKRQGLRQQVQQIEFSIQQEVKAADNQRTADIQARQQQLATLKNERATLLAEWNAADSRYKALESKIETLRKNWHSVDQQTLQFSDDQFCCPTCKRAYDDIDIDSRKEEMTSNFNQEKSKKLQEITQEGASLSTELEGVKAKLETFTKQGESKASEIATAESEIQAMLQRHQELSQNETQQVADKIMQNAEIAALNQQIKSLTEQIDAPYQAEDNSEILLRKKSLQSKLDDLKSSLNSREHRTRQLARIDELEGQESKMAQELADLEGMEHTILLFEKARMNELQRRIDSRFKLVKFKMFEQNINGGEEPCCITLINGVPYADANAAAKIQAGLDIINTLSDHYGVQAPVWVDNRETVVRLPETKCQLINLIVSGEDKKLRVEAEELEAAMA